MFGISYGEFFLIIGATAALLGPKDLPIIAKVAGRIAGKTVGYVQVVRGQFDSVMKQSQVDQVHKELRDTMAQLEAIRYEIRNVSVMHPVPFTRSFNGMEPPCNNGTVITEKSDADLKLMSNPAAKDFFSVGTNPTGIHNQAMAYERLAEAAIKKLDASGNGQNKENLDCQDGLLSVLPISAESAGLLPKRNGDLKGSDIINEAILEAEIAQNAKRFFSQPENQIPTE